MIFMIITCLLFFIILSPNLHSQTLQFNFACLEPYIKGITYVFFRVRIHLLNIRLVKFIQVLHAAVVCSLSLLNRMPLDEYTKFYLSILLVMGIWVVSSIGLLQIISWPMCAWISADCTLKSEIVRSQDMDIFSSG